MDDADIASQMGFASFGSQPSAKKRRYNPAADAVTASSSALTNFGNQKVPRGIAGQGPGKELERRRGGAGGGSGNGSGSGSNSTPLGLGRNGGKVDDVRVTSKEEEIVGEGGVTAEDLRGREAVDGARRRDGGEKGMKEEEEEEEEEAAEKEDEQEGPNYVDDRPPDSPRPNRGSGGGGDEGVGVGVGPHGQDNARTADPSQHLVGARTNAWEQMAETEGRTEGQGYDWAALRRGVRNERGDMVYYDKSFVEDPWKDLTGGVKDLGG